ncbi:MAG: asparaginase domain-containing protein [Patescibacteria group bacterium]
MLTPAGMPKTLPKITLLFAGGATLYTEGEGVFNLRSASDVKQWMAKVPELSLIAEVEPIFLLPDGQTLEPEHWNDVLGIVKQKYAASDGCVILQGVDTMLSTGAFLSFALHGLGKPVVLTGAPVAPPNPQGDTKEFMSHFRTLGVRANLINAVQVSTLNLREVSIVFGNQVMRANRARSAPGATFNMFEADEVDVFGRVDFGIRLKSEQQRKKDPIHITKLKNVQLAVVSLHPGFKPEALADVVREKPDGILIQSFGQQGVPERYWPAIRLATQKDIPVVITGQGAAGLVSQPGVAVISHLTESTLHAKFLWALSKASNSRVVLDLMQKNAAGEFGFLYRDS